MTTTLAYIPSPAQGVWHLGGLPIRAYALLIIVGIVVALVIGDRRWVARGGERGVIYDIALWAVPFGLIGGRLYHVITDWSKYFGPGKPGLAGALQIWDGGLGIWGAVALGGVGAWVACRRRGIPLPAFGDAIAPGIVLAQAIGRLGNYFNQELFGRATTVPWGLEIYERRNSSGAIDPHFGESTGQVLAVVHPTFLYELLWNLLVFAVLIWADRRFRLGHGRLFALYVAGYCVGRFWIELLRADEATQFAGIRVNSFVATFVLVGAVVYFMIAPKGREDPAALAGRPVDEAVDEDSQVSVGELVGAATSSGVRFIEKTDGTAADEDVREIGDEPEPGDGRTEPKSDAEPEDTEFDSDEEAESDEEVESAKGGDAEPEVDEELLTESEGKAAEEPAAESETVEARVAPVEDEISGVAHQAGTRGEPAEDVSAESMPADGSRLRRWWRARRSRKELDHDLETVEADVEVEAEGAEEEQEPGAAVESGPDVEVEAVGAEEVPEAEPDVEVEAVGAEEVPEAEPDVEVEAVGAEEVPEAERDVEVEAVGAEEVPEAEPDVEVEAVGAEEVPEAEPDVEVEAVDVEEEPEPESEAVQVEAVVDEIEPEHEVDSRVAAVDPGSHADAESESAQTETAADMEPEAGAHPSLLRWLQPNADRQMTADTKEDAVSEAAEVGEEPEPDSESEVAEVEAAGVDEEPEAEVEAEAVEAEISEAWNVDAESAEESEPESTTPDEPTSGTSEAEAAETDAVTASEENSPDGADPEATAETAPSAPPDETRQRRWWRVRRTR